MPDEDFNYDDFVKKEFGDHSPVPRGIRWWWWLLAIVVVILFLLFWI